MENDTPNTSDLSQGSTNDLLKSRELDLQEREIALKEQETESKLEIERRNLFLSSPLLIGITSAIFGLLGTGIGAALQGYSSFQLERQEFELSIIKQALEIEDQDEAAKALLFMVNIGAIKSLDNGKIREVAQNPEQLPNLAQLLALTSGAGSISVSPDGSSYAVGNQDGSVSVFDTQGRLLLVFEGHTDAVTSVIYSPDARSLFTGSIDGTVRIIDLSGQLLGSLNVEAGIVGMAVSPDGQTLLARTNKNQVISWNIATLERLQTVELQAPSDSS